MNNELQTTDTRPSYSPEAVSNALALWASARTNADLTRSADLQRDKVQIVKAFFDVMQIHPASVSPVDVRTWVSDHLAHLSPASRYKAVSRLSSFYKWLADEGGMKDLPNPAAAARPKAPKPYATEASKSLSDSDVQALLDTVRAEAERLVHGQPDLTAKRDYAMLMLHLAKGIRRDGIASLMFQDVHINGIVRLTFKNKGGALVTKDIADGGVKAALTDYIESCKASGRTFTKDSPMFVAHRYGSMSNRMINSRSFANNLKRYARAAGISDIHVHMLRHTFARIAGEELGSMTDVQSELNHSSSNTTRVYLARVGVEKDKSSEAVMSRFKKR